MRTDSVNLRLDVLGAEPSIADFTNLERERETIQLER